MALIGVPGRASRGEMQAFVDRYGVHAIPQIPDGDDRQLWQAFEVGYQPWWAIIRPDGSWESRRGSIPTDILREALSA